MAYEHAPLTEPELGPAAWKVVQPGAPAPLQAMVARGLAPLGPRDLVVALYQLWVTNVPQLAEQAAKTITGLPPNILLAGLRDPTTPAGALDFAGRKLPRNADALEVIVRHPQVHDETLVALSRVCPEGICDLLADNQSRWLRCPAIVESLYQNPNCRMSVAQRMMELAVREGLDLKLPNIEEIKQAIFASEEEPPQEADDEQFRRIAQRVIEGQSQVIDRMVAAGPAQEVDLETVREEAGALAGLDAALEQAPADDLSLPLPGEEAGEAAAEAPPAPGEAPVNPEVRGDRITQISKLQPMKKIRLALIGNAFERAVLIRDSNKAVCLSVIKSPKVKENEVVAYSANRSLSHEVIRYIANRRDWTKLYAVKLNLVLNPKTPMASAMTLLSHLHAHDVKKVAHSRNIPSALATAAKRRMDKRR
ncbi:MAG: hypothetical protein KDK70_06165 [Myxococcales bacterium]|nr:hypothetical protein [Myxococcales bacterium]